MNTSCNLLIPALAAVCVLIWPTTCYSQLSKIELDTVDDRHYVVGMEILPKSNSILTLINNGSRLTICDWGCSDGEARSIHSRPVDTISSRLNYRLSKNAEFLAYAIDGRGDQHFEIVDLANGNVATSLPYRQADGFSDNSRDFDRPRAIEFTPDLGRVYIVFNRSSVDTRPHCEIRFYDTKAGSILGTFSPHEFDRELNRKGEGPCSDVAVSPDGRLLATVGGERKNANVVKLFDAETHTVVSRVDIKLPLLQQCITKKLLWLEGERFVAVSQGYHLQKQEHMLAVQLYALKGDQLTQVGNDWFCRRRFFDTDMDLDIATIRLSPDGKLLSIAQYSEFQVFSLQSGRPLVTEAFWREQSRHTKYPVFSESESELWFINEKAEIVNYPFRDPDAPRSIRK